MNIETLRQFFLCWMLIDMAIYIFTVVAVLLATKSLARLQAKLFGVSEEIALEMLYSYVAFFKLFIIVFNFSPWLALVLMSPKG